MSDQELMDICKNLAELLRAAGQSDESIISALEKVARENAIDDSMTFYLRAANDHEPIEYKINRLKDYAARRFLTCTGVIHRSTRSATVKFSAVPVPPTVVRIRTVLKHALRTEGLRAIAKEVEHANQV